MKGDKLYCKSCGRISNDVYKLYDTRYDGAHIKYINKKPIPELYKKDRFKPQCPFCLSIHLVNATQILEEGDRITTENPSANNWSYMALYHRLQKILKTKDLNNTDNKGESNEA